MNQQQKRIMESVAKEVEQKLANEGSGHDWWHVARVQNLARHIGRKEKADLFVVELAALLHDIADWKFHNRDETVGPKVAGAILEKNNVANETIASVRSIIANMSYKGAGSKTKMKTIEGEIVQDADRLDAIGAIGIARVFAYGGYSNRSMHDPNTRPALRQTKEEYFKNNSTSINHFYEKLLLLKDRLNTQTAKKIAKERHAFMQKYLKKFFEEWKGKN